MHGGNTSRQRAQKRVVAKTAHAVYALAHAANLIDGTQRARRHSVGRAGDKRNIGSVLFGNSNIGDLAVHATRKRMAQLKGSLVIVVIDARRALDMLADQHNGHTARLNRATVLVGDHSCHQNNAVNRVVLE